MAAENPAASTHAWTAGPWVASQSGQMALFDNVYRHGVSVGRGKTEWHLGVSLQVALVRQA